MLEFLKAAITRELRTQTPEQCEDPVERLFPTELVCDTARPEEADERTKWNDDHPAQLAYLEHLLATQPYGRAHLVDELSDALRSGRPNAALVVLTDDEHQSGAREPTPTPERVSVVAVTGPPGYGKSTLVAWTMALVSGLVEPDAEKNCSEFHLVPRARPKSKLVPFYHFMQCPFSTQEQAVPERVWTHLSTQIRRFLEAHAQPADGGDGENVDGEGEGEGEGEGVEEASSSSANASTHKAGAQELLALVRRLGRAPHTHTRFLLVLDGLKYTDNVNNMDLLPRPGELPPNVLVLASALDTHRPSRAFFRSYNAFEVSSDLSFLS